MCNLQGVLFYHIECPDYVKKFDDVRNYQYLKRQIFNLLIMPYMNYRIIEFKTKNARKEISDLDRKTKFIEYPEEMYQEPLSLNQIVLNNKSLTDKYVEGVNFEPDPPAEE
jgi:hypothetical protein